MIRNLCQKYKKEFEQDKKGFANAMKEGLTGLVPKKVIEYMIKNSQDLFEGVPTDY